MQVPVCGPAAAVRSSVAGPARLRVAAAQRARLHARGSGRGRARYGPRRSHDQKVSRASTKAPTIGSSHSHGGSFTIRASFAYGKLETIAKASSATPPSTAKPGQRQVDQHGQRQHRRGHRRRHAGEELAVLGRDVEPGQPDRGAAGHQDAGDRGGRRSAPSARARRRPPPARPGRTSTCRPASPSARRTGWRRRACGPARRPARRTPRRRPGRRPRCRTSPLHGQEDRQQAEAEAGQGAGVDQREARPGGAWCARRAAARRLVGDERRRDRRPAARDGDGSGRGRAPSRCRSPRPGWRWRRARRHRTGVPPAPTGPAARAFRRGAAGLPNDARRDGDYPSFDAGAKGFSARASSMGSVCPAGYRAAGWCHGPFAPTGPEFGGLHHCTAERPWRDGRTTVVCNDALRRFHPPGGRDGPLSGCPCDESN